jgi:hypothetical protein
VSGNWARELRKLRKFAGKLKQAGAKATLANLAENLAEECISLVHDGFDKERDPYRKKWAPRVEDQRAADRIKAKKALKAEQESVTVSRTIDASNARAGVRRKRKKRRKKRSSTTRRSRTYKSGVTVSPIIVIRAKRGGKRKTKANARPILIGKSLRLRNGFHQFSSSNEFGVYATAEYAIYHQTGTSKMVARKMLPDDSRPLPRQWALRLEDVAMAFYETILGDD